MTLFDVRVDVYNLLGGFEGKRGIHHRIYYWVWRMRLELAVLFGTSPFQSQVLVLWLTLLLLNAAGLKGLKMSKNSLLLNNGYFLLLVHINLYPLMKLVATCWLAGCCDQFLSIFSLMFAIRLRVSCTRSCTRDILCSRKA